jgi:nucleoside-diphosphate-sugar epimerase
VVRANGSRPPIDRGRAPTMKWIITGGAGFIGCHAAARFQQAGHHVVVVDNLSRPGLSLRELVATLDRAFDRPHNPSFAEWRPGDQRVFVADIRKAERALDWKPTVSTPVGVDRLLAWVRGNPGLFRASGL